MGSFRGPLSLYACSEVGVGVSPSWQVGRLRPQRARQLVWSHQLLQGRVGMDGPERHLEDTIGSSRCALSQTETLSLKAVA